MIRAARPLKRFGQHFLVDKNIVKKIVRTVDISRRDSVLEIGPGSGALSFDLAKRAKRFFAVELDSSLYRELRQKFQGKKRAEIICCDILKFKIKECARKNKIKKFKVVGNLPYYLTTPILEYLFKNLKYISDIFITVQKEVADRLTACPKTKAYGCLTCFVNYFCIPKVVFKIKSGSFWPRPKVESSFLRLTPLEKSRRKFKVASENLFFEVVRKAFGQRRKKLYNSLSGIVKKEDLSRLSSQDVLSLRAGDLDIADFARLSNLIFDFSKKR